jgi:trigger factor
MGGVALPGAKGENALVELGGESYLPGFSEGLLGAKVPSERQVPVTFPADYSVKDVAGKQATFNVKVKELKQKELPKLDDEFAKDLGAESLAALRDKIRGDLEARKKGDVEAERRQSVLTSLIAQNPFDLAPSMVASQAERMVKGAAERVQQLMGRRITLSEHELAALRKDSEKDAEFQVRSGLLLLEVSKAEKLEVSEEELAAEMERVAKEAGESVERVQAFYSTDERKDGLRFKVLEEKTVAFLLSKAVDSAPDEAEIPSSDDAKSKPKRSKK